MESSITKAELEQVNPTTIGLALAKEAGYEVSAANTILSPGKFQGEHVSTLYFWDAYLNGDGEMNKHGDIQFTLTMSEQEHLGLPAPCYRLYVDDNGFVYGNV